MAVASLTATTEEVPARQWRISIQFDNDLLANDDRNYTSGARMVLTRKLDSSEGWSQRLLRAWDSAFLINSRAEQADSSASFYSSFSLTQQMFTPDARDEPVPPEGQRPYAGWLGIESSVQRLQDGLVTALSFNVGITGPNSFAHEAQDWTHENISGESKYQGWDSQVPEEITLNMLYERRQLQDWLVDLTRNWPLEWDAFSEWGFSLGNHRTDAFAGGVLRFGKNIPPNLVTPRIQLGSFVHPFRENGRESTDWSWHGLMKLSGLLVAHDISLDGPLFRDYQHSVDSRPLVGELVLGLGIRYKALQVLISRTFRTEEFHNQSSNHEYGSILVNTVF